MRFRVEPQTLFKKKPKQYADQDWKTDDKIPIALFYLIISTNFDR